MVPLTGEEESSFPLTPLPRNTLGLGNHLGRRKRRKKRQKVPQAGLSCLPLAAPLHGQVSPRNISVCSSPSVMFCPLAFPWWQRPLSPVPCPQGTEGAGGAGTEGLKAQIWPEFGV